MKFLKQATYITYVKTVKISPNKHTDLPRFLFLEESLKIKKGLELASRPIYS